MAMLIRLHDRKIFDARFACRFGLRDLFLGYNGKCLHGEVDPTYPLPEYILDLARLDYLSNGCEVVYRIPIDVLGARAVENTPQVNASRDEVWSRPWLARPLHGPAHAGKTLREAIDSSMKASIVRQC